MRKLCLLLLLSGLFVSAGYCQVKTRHRYHKAAKDAHHKNQSHVRYGTASFYATKFNGRKTASGEIYSSSKKTAACNVFPLHTWIRVTNLRNNRSVIVKINDRLYSKNKRLVDLSKSGARELGYTGRGLTRVKVEALPGYQLSGTQ
jgi:rare lipoprotein A